MVQWKNRNQKQLGDLGKPNLTLRFNFLCSILKNHANKIPSVYINYLHSSLFSLPPASGRRSRGLLSNFSQNCWYLSFTPQPNWDSSVVTNNYFFFSFSFLINFLTCRSYSVFSLLDPSNLSVTFGLNLCFFLHLSSSLSEWLSLPLIHFHYPTPDLHLSSGLPKGPPIKFHADHQHHKSEAQVWQCFFIFSLWIIPHWCRWL